VAGFAALARLASSHNRMFCQAAAAYSKLPSNSTTFTASEASTLIDSQVPEECGGSRKRSEGENIYFQCVTAVYALARDPSPSVACLGLQVLRIMGVDPAQIAMAARAGASGAVSHLKKSSAPTTSHLPGVQQRSTSLVTSTAGGCILIIVVSDWV